MGQVRLTALCIRQWDWSETSQTVWLFTREQGLVRGLAKGSKRAKSAFGGGIEVLTRGEARGIIKAGAELALLTSWDLEEMFPWVRRSLGAHRAGLYIAELIQHAMDERDPHPGLFDAAVSALRGLGEEGGIGRSLLAFQWAVLDEAGYRPELGADVRTGEVMGDRGAYLFHPELGGLVGEGTEGAWRVRAETVGLLRRAAAERGGERGGELAGEAAAVIERANRLLAAYLRHVLGREPNTQSVLFGMNLPK